MKDNDYQLIKKKLREYVNKILANTNCFRSDLLLNGRCLLLLLVGELWKGL